MKLEDFDLSLIWPLELFLWEAHRVAKLFSPRANNSNFTSMVTLLMTEAFHDGDMAASLQQSDTGSWSTPSGNSHHAAYEALAALIQQPSGLRGYVEPQYWIERKGRTKKGGGDRSLSLDFFGLIVEMSELGYFPKAFPEDCVDVFSTSPDEISLSIRKAIHVDVNWPSDLTENVVTSDVLFSLIEYFHDQAQRPRTRFSHSSVGCGWHYLDHNKESGGVVYRWRVNQLLDAHGSDHRLGTRGDEKGRLLRYSNPNIKELEAALEEKPADSDEERVSVAIRMYRNRRSTIVERRAAIATLAGYLEKHRDAFKAGQLTKGDEGTLFHLFNKFAIRHNAKAEKQDYGEEYLDWIYWVTLAGIQLVKELNNREV